ncbi:MAG: sulfite exporter TauE/SafE family protein [Flavobacterium sp.]|uniref:sulfite exporter TauE/SafE family protein n=1 Tax=Flavobacterium sp. TaxID=239 RepID=UPI0011FC9729|nr:sulfite exporter TauE/SafE family protein [Flavobacterium sp.]RZJ68681.1 MAG: sulfite exporter TauE/SafE family protein [Flavobacterium sp.]
MLLAALILGLTSSLHCIGMCGPIALMLPLDRQNPTRKAVQLFAYHIGRLSSYAMLGLVFGLVGRGLYLAGFQQKLSLFMGIIVILIAVVPERKWAMVNGSGLIFRLISKVKTAMGKQFKNGSVSSVFFIGTLNGLLPCGMVYTALFGAIALQTAGLGVLFMLVFGIGTLPLMAGIQYLYVHLSLNLRKRMARVVPVMAVFVGSLFILRGLGLGIPFVSPATMSLLVKAFPDCQ